jgi:DNA polymerase-3 subunit alpha
MSDKPFVHLHVHSEYSLLDGANKCADLAKATKDMGMNAVALTDHGVMYGCIEFYNCCKENGVKPILGCEVYVEPRGHKCRDGRDMYHLVLLASNDTGYHNLIKLVSVANTDGFYHKPRIDHELLARHSEGIIGSSACLGGEIPSLIIKGDVDGAVSRAQLYRDILGRDNFFLEIQHNSIPEQAIVNKTLAEMAKREGYGLIATNDAHYMNKSDATWHDVLLCVQTRSQIDNPDRYKFTGDDYYFRSPEEMWAIFGNELPESLLNTQLIADRCEFEFKPHGYYLPEFPLPEGETLETHLSKIAHSGLKRRLRTDDIPEKYEERLKYELSVIAQMGFPGYFCIVADIITAAKKKGIPIGPGRGSAAGSVVAWALGITDLDPLRYNLLFERFLNPERISMPDIDTDVSDKRRDELIEYIVDKYGSDRVAQIITFDRMKSKGAITDVGRTLGIPVPEVKKVTKLIPNAIKSGIKNIPDAIEGVPELKELYDNDPSVKKMLDYAKNIEGIARHCSQHAAGIVITPRPTVDMVPVRKFGESQIVTQYSMEPVEKLGLVKMDFLGLKTLSVLEGALANIEAGGKGKIDLDEIPMDDAKTFEMLQRGETLGIFQLESSGMTALVRRMKPDCFEDLIALVALYRPGPLESGMADQYVKRKHKEEGVHYLHPLFEDSMKETYGVILYQEQVMQSASALAGYTLGEADLLRRAMGKKKVEEMEKQRSKFIDGAMKNGVSSAKAGEIFDIIEKFAGYGFNKSHSAAYALISYRTAWLKANYGPEFMAAYLSSIVGSTMEELGKYIRSVREAGFTVAAPDINESKDDFTVVSGGVIRVGLSGIAKAGSEAVKNIIEVRESAGKFTSFWDFLTKVDLRTVNKGVIENLIKAGAFDGLEKNRAGLLNSMPSFVEMASKRQDDPSQASLFEDSPSFSLEPEMEPCEPFTEKAKLICEKESMGLYISGHPFDHYADSVEPYITCPVSALDGWRPSQTYAVTAGLLAGVKERYTKKGDPMAIAQIEDADATAEAVFYPRQWAKFKPLLAEGELYIIRGQVKDDRNTSIVVEDIYTNEEYKGKLTPNVILRINEEGKDEKFYGGICKIISANPGKSPVLIKLISPEETTVLTLGKRLTVTPSDKLKKALEEFGEGAVNCIF